MSKNLVELMVNAACSYCGEGNIENKMKVALEVVKEHIGEVAKSCPECHGEGEWDSDFEASGRYKCTFCKGSGVIARTDEGTK